MKTFVTINDFKFEEDFIALVSEGQTRLKVTVDGFVEKEIYDSEHLPTFEDVTVETEIEDITDYLTHDAIIRLADEFIERCDNAF